MPTVLIVGANRGLGLAFVESYRAKGWDVIACVRDPRSMPQIEGVKVYKLDSGSLTDSKMVAGEISASQIKLDVIVVNGAVSLDPSPSLETPMAILDLSYEVNTRGPSCLFQAMRPHMVPGAKFAAISSVLGSIMEIDKGGKGAYGSTLAAKMHMVRKLHFENPEFLIFASDPGHSDTHMGWRGARWYNSDARGKDVHEVAPALIDLIDKATRDTMGGWMTDWKGERCLV